MYKCKKPIIAIPLLISAATITASIFSRPLGSGNDLSDWKDLSTSWRLRTYSEETLHALASFRQVIVLHGSGDQLGLGIGVLCISFVLLLDAMPGLVFMSAWSGIMFRLRADPWSRLLYRAFTFPALQSVE